MMDLEINGNRLVVEDLGPKDAPAMIAHHGAPGIGDHTDAEAEFGPYSDTFRVIVFDARGSGASEGSPPLTHEQWAADVDGLREHFGIDRFVMAGGSYGGFIAMEYALRHPDRLLALVLRDTAADNEHHDKAIQNALTSPRVNVSPEMLVRVMEGRCHSDEDFEECFQALVPLYDHSRDPARETARMERTFRHETHNFAFGHNVPNYNLKPLLPQLIVPTLVLCGRHDWVTPVSESEKIHALIPGSKLVVFEDSGHSPYLEEPDRLRATVRDFLTTALAAAGI